MAVNPSPNSRNVGVPLVRDADGREIYEIRDPVKFEYIQGMTRVKMRASDTLHSLAYQFYGDAMLWWFLADFNSIFDPTTELFEGQELFIPPNDFVRAWVQRPVIV